MEEKVNKELFLKNFPLIKKIELSVGDFFGLYENKCITIGEDKVCIETRVSYPMTPDENAKNPDDEYIERERFLSALSSLHIENWLKHYSPLRHGFAVCDGDWWSLYIYYSNKKRTLEISGSNDYPEEFNKLRELFRVSEKQKSIYEKWDDAEVSIIPSESKKSKKKVIEKLKRKDVSSEEKSALIETLYRDVPIK